MAATLHLSGVKTPTQFFSKTNNASFCQPIHTRRQQYIHLEVSLRPCLPSIAGLCLSLRLRCEASKVDILERSDTQSQYSDQTPDENELTCVMKFGGSSVASADRMREVADLILSFPEERPVIVFSAMGKTTNKLLAAGEKAVSCGVSNVSDLEELTFIKDLHLRTADELGILRETISSNMTSSKICVFGSLPMHFIVGIVSNKMLVD